MLTSEENELLCQVGPGTPAGELLRRYWHPLGPLQEFVGFYWAYLGPDPAPAIPHYDIWVRKDGRLRITVKPILDCNWFTPTENSVDSSHSEIMHSVAALRPGGPRLANTTRGAI